MYGPVYDEGSRSSGRPDRRIDPQFLRQVVADPTGEPAGTIIVDTSRTSSTSCSERQAMRYGVGLGRAGFEWAGAQCGVEAELAEMDAAGRNDRASARTGKYSEDNGGMPPGLDNPLGARALYIFQDGEDTLFRLHGSPEWNSIGKSVSSGCVRLMNQDIIDLYGRVPGPGADLVTYGIGMA